MKKEELIHILDILYKEAEQAKTEGEIPVSACLRLKDGMTFYSHNEVEKRNDPYAHAEFLVLKKAMEKTKSRYLKGSTLIVTLEPCLVCMGALLKAGVSSLYYVLTDEKGGALSHYHAFVDDRLMINEIKDDRFSEQVESFFRKLRNQEE